MEGRIIDILPQPPYSVNVQSCKSCHPQGGALDFMADYPVITISRQHGSAGGEIARQLADRLGVPFYDNALITLAAQQSGFSPDLFENADQNASNSLLFSLSMYGAADSGAMPLGDRVFLIQSETIRSVASKGPCVILGRCADYVLREGFFCLSIYLHAPVQWRIERAVSAYGLNRGDAPEAIRRTDRRRSVYYAHFTGQKWGDAGAYQLTLDTSVLGVAQTAALLESYARLAADR